MARCKNIAVAALQVAGEIVTVKRCAARTMKISFVVDDAFSSPAIARSA